MNVTIMCRNDELSLMMSWVGCLLKDSELFMSFSENSQTLLKILLNFIYLVALNVLVNNQLNSSSNSTHHFEAYNCHRWLQCVFSISACDMWNLKFTPHNHSPTVIIINTYEEKGRCHFNKNLMVKILGQA